jgi:DNA-binding NtrC family response regulator
MKISTDVNLNKLVHIATQSDSTVLITGKTGTGKSTLAKQIHLQSKRAPKPFICVNLASLHEGILESELFGHERGAFTGAEQKRVGKLEMAQGGTIFLDEVSELPPRLQARLLEFLQSKTLCPVGSNREVCLDVRIIAATHRNLERAVVRGEFREDLLHRLRVVSIPMRSLKDRYDELDSLIHDCLKEVSLKAGKTIFRLAPPVVEKFETYSWPGNLRELRNVLEYAVVSSAENEISVSDLPHWFMNSQDQDCKNLDSAILGLVEVPLTLNFQETLERFEKEYIQRALSRYRGRINRTARETGINKTTLIRRLRAYGISPS